MGVSLQPGSGRRTLSYRRQPMSDINVTPFVDVMLILLIVFMVTAPMMTQGVDVNLPEVDAAPITAASEPIQISIKANGKVFVQSRQVKLSGLPARLKAIIGEKNNTMIMIRADKNIQYNKVVEVMTMLQGAGLYNVGLETQLPE